MKQGNPVSFLLHVIGQLFVSNESGENKELAHYTFRRLGVVYALEGLYYGVFSSYVYYVLKTALEVQSLTALVRNKDMLVTLATMCGIIGMLFSYNFVYYFQGKPKKKLFYASASLFGIAAAGFAFVPPGKLFLPLIACASLADAIKLPGRNALLQNNFAQRERSRFLGNLVLLASLSGIIGIILGGKILDKNHELFSIVFPIALLLPVASSLILSKIKTTPKGIAVERTFRFRDLLKPYHDLMKVLARDKHFLVFEAGFFLYGCGFMIMAAMSPIFYYDVFGAKSSQFGYTVIIYNVIAMFAPVIGKFADKSDPMKICSISFTGLAIFPIVLLFSTMLWQGYSTHLLYSFSMVGVILAWNVGPIFFSGQNDATAYLGIHATLTGLRSLIIFPIAGYIKEHTSTFDPVFSLASSLFVIAAVLMFLLHRSARKSPLFQSTLSGRFEVKR